MRVASARAALAGRAAAVALLCAVSAAPAAAQSLTGASHVLRGAQVSAAATAGVLPGGRGFVATVGASDPPGFAANLTTFRGGALGLVATLAGGFGPVDADGDGVHVLADLCPTVADPAQQNNDADGQGDACDLDDDNDALLDVEEAEVGTDPFVADSDGDTLSDSVEVVARGSNPLAANTDGDPFPDGTDNCVNVPNQFLLEDGVPMLDTDGDGLGDDCDPDARGKPAWTFESGPVRALALTPDGTRLLVTNVPEGRLEIFDVTGTGISPAGSVPVGLEPVAVSVRSDDEAWVVNHLSDSVSIVRLDGEPRVVRTLLVGDEPRDIVFGGPGSARAFVTCAHRGQNSPFPQSDYALEGIGRADVWVFDANALGISLGGNRLALLTLFGDKPRALAVNADGSRVYAAVMNSGNRTATVAEVLVCNSAPSVPCTVSGATYPGGPQPPADNHEGFFAPKTGLVVKFDALSGQWRDELGRNWTNGVRFDLPDLDVFEIDANANPPVQLASFSGVGTTIFNLLVNSATGAIYASNTDARNEIRFEGRGVYAALFKPAGVPPSVRGRLHESRVTVIRDGVVLPRHLNPHIPYGTIPMPSNVKPATLATPLDMALSPDGATLYVASFGTSEIGVIDAAALEAGGGVPAALQFPVGGGGPVGLVVAGSRLYTLARFTNEVVVLDRTTGAELDRRGLFDAEPEVVTSGRPFLYDALSSSSNGEAACASCHIFADMDDLAWDLGNPDGDRVQNPNIVIGQTGPLFFHPNKGPMTTQTLRGLAHNGPQHWRGDRTGPANVAFLQFNGAFDALLGRDEGPIAPADMQAFASFVLEITPPPNPIRQLSNALRDAFAPTPSELRGSQLYFAGNIDGTLSCNTCHQLTPRLSFFGTNGFSSIEGEPQEFKIPHLRNAYQKVGMFGAPASPQDVGGDNSHKGPQVRGVAFLHDGVVDTLQRFMHVANFNLTLQGERDLEAFVLAFDSDLSPAVGQQVTLTPSSAADTQARVDLLVARAQVLARRLQKTRARECDLVVKGVVHGDPRGWLLADDATFRSDGADARWTLAELRALAAVSGVALTFTCVPPGSGPRLAVDRDLDGVGDFVESALLGTDALVADSDGDGASDGAEDADGDRIPDARDSCRFAPDIAQRDAGGIGATADGVGNACQCGDLTANGTIEQADVDLLRAHLADPLGVPLAGDALERCRVGLGSLDCDMVQVAELERALAAEPGARLDQVCDAALP